jgi:glycosyltransferase involved in cell wall biosynthesis
MTTRLLQLVHGYPPAIGGVEVSVRDMCERLVAEHGFEVTVLTTDARTVANFHDSSLPKIPAPRDEVQNGVRVVRYPVRTFWSPVLKQVQRVAYRLRLPGNDVLRTLYNGPICPPMRLAVASFDADVICAASFPLNHMRYPFLRPEPRPPVVLIGAVHTTDDWGFNRPNLLRLVNLSYATVAHTAHERDWLVAHGASPERVHVIGHGVDLDGGSPGLGFFRLEHGIDEEDYVVAYLGQQARHKGIDTLIAVFPALLETRPNASLVIGGAHTPYSAEIERLVASLPAHIRERVFVLSDLSEGAKFDLLDACDVFASPSEVESFGITTIEAWSRAKPVIVGDAPSQRSLVNHGVNGLIVRYADRASLLDALLRLTDRELRRRLGDNGRSTVETSYDRRKVEGEYARLLREAASAFRIKQAGEAGCYQPSG